MSTPIIINQLVMDTIEVAIRMKQKSEKMEHDHMVAVRELAVAFRKEMNAILETVKD